MNELKDQLRRHLLECGAIAVGFARVTDTDKSDMAMLDRWIAENNNADMKYMERHSDLRRDPRLLLDGAKTVISLAFPSLPTNRRSEDLPVISLYAYGTDYHNALRKRLRPFCRMLREKFDASSRICIDSAPVRERYWAVKSGIGFIGRNGCLIVPGNSGSFVVIAEILTDLELEPDNPSTERCIGCNACIAACPGQAILPNATIDARRCISYLTIEHQGDFQRDAMNILGPENPLRHKAGNLFGCDICREVCPHNRQASGGLIGEFEASPEILRFTADDALTIDNETFNRIFGHTPIKRTGHAGLRRNALAIRRKQPTHE